MTTAIDRTAATYGYGQVEPNHLSAQRTGQIYAQRAAAAAITALENGMFVKYGLDASGNPEVNFTDTHGEWMLVYNEEKLYEPGQTRKDFALVKTDQVNGEIVPRVFKTNVGDIFTTNTLATGSYAVGDVLTVGTTGILEVNASPGTTVPQWQVIKETTMPDAQAALKLQRIL